MTKAPPGRPSPPRGRGRAPFEVDRVIVLRIAFAAIALAFLYLIVKVSMMAFGGSSARETKRIERAVDTMSAPVSAERAVPSATGSPPR